jgi:hypothetical protein
MKTILKQQLRSLLRKEQTNREKKIQVILRVVGLYLKIESNFYAICAQEVVQEFNMGLSSPQSNELNEVQQKTYSALLYLVADMDW